MDWVLKNADLLSALFGLAAAVVLGWPALKAVRDKRRWEQQRRLAARHKNDAASHGALEDIRDHVEAGQLGGANEAAWFNLIGFALLALSFIFLAMAALER